MRSSRLWGSTLGIATRGIALTGTALLLLAGTARAEPSGAAWDDSHMQSSATRGRGAAPARPPIQGSDRYHQIAEKSAPAPAVGVSETTLEISQHEWEPGGPRLGKSTGGSLFGAQGPLTAPTGVRAERSVGLRSQAASSTRRHGQR